MPTRYRLVPDESAKEVLVSLSQSEGRALDEFLRGLAKHPFQVPAQRVIDADGRPNDVTIFDRHVITYWADQAVSELRVAAIEFF